MAPKLNDAELLDLITAYEPDEYNDDLPTDANADYDDCDDDDYHDHDDMFDIDSGLGSAGFGTDEWYE